MKFVVGLGNPGKKYQATRHNLGFLVVDELAARQSITVQKEICGVLTGHWVQAGETILLGKPQTYMNRIGPAVAELLRYFRGTAEDLVLIYDDVDLPFGRIRIRSQGSAGGHRGLVSVIENLAGNGGRLAMNRDCPTRQDRLLLREQRMLEMPCKI